MKKLSNISLSEYRQFLRAAGCTLLRTSGGHEVWTRTDLTRPIIFQTHIDPVPEFIIRNALRALGISREEFFKTLDR
jgi:hypothetical protein